LAADWLLAFSLAVDLPVVVGRMTLDWRRSVFVSPMTPETTEATEAGSRTEAELEK
jgi:hypothetical protein